MDDGELKRVRRWGAAFMVSGLILCDVFLEFFCVRFPLLFYLISAGVGFGVAGPFSRIAPQRRWLSFVTHFLCRTVVGLGVVGTVFLTINLQPSNSKCSWRRCGRILGPHLLRSPFPAPPMSCEVLSRCINEYPYTKPQYADVLGLLKDMKCPPP